MLVVEPAAGPPVLRHESFASFPLHLQAGDVLVLNDTRVFPARLFAEPKGAMQRPIEILLTRQREPLIWECWCKPARRVRPGDRLRFSDGLTATVLEKEGGTLRLRFETPGENEFWNEVERIGEAPLPPYIHSSIAKQEAREKYQTVYADRRGAVAAPTAGLHFSPEILEQIRQRGTEIVRITLHVGPGTFKPVEVERISDHRMEPEIYDISEEVASRLNRAREEKRRIVAVGTTTVRALESAVRAGEGAIPAGERETSLFITPGFDFQVIDAMLTNFHLPRSTLLMLVSAFAGLETIRGAYREAIVQRYRFYSFGDCMFLVSRLDA